MYEGHGMLSQSYDDEFARPIRLPTAYSALVPCNQGRPLSYCGVCYMVIATKIVNRMFTKEEAKKLDSRLKEKCISYMVEVNTGFVL